MIDPQALQNLARDRQQHLMQVAEEGRQIKRRLPRRRMARRQLLMQITRLFSMLGL